MGNLKRIIHLLLIFFAIMVGKLALKGQDPQNEAGFSACTIANAPKGIISGEITIRGIPLLNADRYRVRVFDDDPGDSDVEICSTFLKEESRSEGFYVKGTYLIEYDATPGRWDPRFPLGILYRPHNPDIYLVIDLFNGSNWIQVGKSKVYKNHNTKNELEINMEIYRPTNIGIKSFDLPRGLVNPGQLISSQIHITNISENTPLSNAKMVVALMRDNQFIKNDFGLPAAKFLSFDINDFYWQAGLSRYIIIGNSPTINFRIPTNLPSGSRLTLVAKGYRSRNLKHHILPILPDSYPLNNEITSNEIIVVRKDLDLTVFRTEDNCTVVRPDSHTLYIAVRNNGISGQEYRDAKLIISRAVEGTTNYVTISEITLPMALASPGEEFETKLFLKTDFNVGERYIYRAEIMITGGDDYEANNIESIPIDVVPEDMYRKRCFLPAQ